jgi:hypothetical protein
MADPNKQRLLKQAEKLMGRKELAAGLRVTEGQLASWVEGFTDMPDRKLLLLSELLEKFANKPGKQ